MAFPTTVASTGAATPAVNTTSHPITLPTHAAGDLLVVAFTAHSHATHTPSGTGWSSSTVTNGFDVVRHSVFTKIATGSAEALTITTSAATQSSHRARSIRAGAGMALEVAVGPSGTGYSSNTYYGGYSPPAGLQDYLSIATVGNDGSTQYTGISAPFGGFLSTPGASTVAASTGMASANEATTITSIAQFTGSPVDVDWCGFPIVVWEVAGGGDFTAAQADSAAGADSTSASLTATRAQAETSVTADTQNRTMLATRAQAESSAGTDTQAETLNTPAAQAESNTSSDTQTSAAAINKSQAEASAGADAQSTLMSATRAQAETSVGADTQAGSMSAAQAQAESSASADTQSGSMTATRTQAESGAGADTQAGAIVGATSVLESSAGTDTQTGAMAATRAQAEASAGADTQAALLARFAAVAETAVGTDAVSAIMVAVRAMTEAAAGADTTQGLQATATTVLESATATDVIVRSMVATGAQVEVQLATDIQVASLLALAQTAESTSGVDLVSVVGGGTVIVVHQDEHGNAVDVTEVVVPPDPPGGKYIVRKLPTRYAVAGGVRRFIVSRR